MAIPHAPYLQPRRHPHVEVFVDEDNLPESDGRPMSETDRHRELMFGLLHALEQYFLGNPNVYITGNIFVYYRDQAGELLQVSPDIFIVRGISKHERRIYRVDKEGKAPEVVIELTSKRTKHIDQVTKPAIYAQLGVQEYFLFDPYKETMATSLRGFRLQDGAYVRMPDKPCLRSEVLGLELRVEEGQLRLYDPKAGERLRTHKESEADRRTAERKATQAEHKAAQELKMRQEAEARAFTAEAEAVRLREDLAKLQRKSKLQKEKKRK